jgi:hypothetical protein
VLKRILRMSPSSAGKSAEDKGISEKWYLAFNGLPTKTDTTGWVTGSY